jgi:hypothetical protein
MTDEIKDIIFKALQDSYVQAVIIHNIDGENSAIEMDYETIASVIINSLSDNNYEIIKTVEN